MTRRYCGHICSCPHDCDHDCRCMSACPHPVTCPDQDECGVRAETCACVEPHEDHRECVPWLREHDGEPKEND